MSEKRKVFDDYDVTTPIPKPASTPPPRSKEEVAVVIARIDDRTKVMTDVHLPRIEEIAKRADNGVRGLESRVSVVENRPQHKCTEKERQLRQDDDIDEIQSKWSEFHEKIKSLSTFRNWFIGSIATVVILAVAFAITTRSIESANSTNIENAKSAIARHDALLETLPRKSDIDRLEKAISNVPDNVTEKINENELKIVPTVESVEDDVNNLPLKPHELKQLKRILDNARKRNNGDSKVDI